jgi:hypothetical protein
MWFEGKVTQFWKSKGIQLFHIKYEDDNEEDISLEELLTILREEDYSGVASVPVSRCRHTTHTSFEIKELKAAKVVAQKNKNTGVRPAQDKKRKTLPRQDAQQITVLPPLQDPLSYTQIEEDHANRTPEYTGFYFWFRLSRQSNAKRTKNCMHKQRYIES